MRKIVHISGYSLAEIPGLVAVDQRGRHLVGRFGDWEHVCWGDTTLKSLGRIPMGLWLAREIRARMIIWSTGFSKETNGRIEAEYMYERALGSYEALLHDFPDRFKSKTWGSETAYRRWIKKTAVLETDSTNTFASVVAARETLFRRRVLASSMVYLVSSANHVPRIARDMLVTFKIGQGEVNAELTTPVVVPAATSYGGKLPKDTIVRDLGD